MKVNIGPYLNYYGPYQIAEILLFFVPKIKDEHGFQENHPCVRKFGNFLAHGSFKAVGREDRCWFNSLCEWIHSKRQRRVHIETHRYDHWNAHNTISMIALPILKDLKQAKISYGYIDDEDAPEHLRSINAETKDTDGGYDSNSEARYTWVLDEIIWALEQDQPDCDWESQYTIEQCEIDLSEHPEDEGKTCIPVRWIKEGKYDHVGRANHQERIDNGFRLFGKYFQTLWD